MLRRRSSPTPFALLSLLVTLLIPRAAGAYCRTTTCVECPKDDAGCVIGGKPLFWTERCVSFTAQRSGSERLGIPHDTTIALVSQAFEAWLQADCGGANPSIEAAATPGPAVCGRPDYDPDGGNANVWMFHDEDWPYAGNALAVTVVTFDEDSGAILDADVELNGTRELTVGDARVDYDLASIVQHEAGHFLGLSHSGDKSATMWRRIARGTTDKRTLEVDDLAAVCAVYPPARAAGTCDFTPRNGFSPNCSRPDGCTTVPGRTASGGFSLLVLLALSAARCGRRSRVRPDRGRARPETRGSSVPACGARRAARRSAAPARARSSARE
jgi:hypothetical protein